MAMWGLDIVAASSLLLLTAGGADAVTCKVKDAPRINVTPRSQAIAYDFDKSSAQLSGLKSDTISPYAPDADVTTGGLRADQPEIRLEVRWHILEYPTLNLVCLSYSQIDVDITLKPKIYIAKEFGADRRCRAAILEHEKKHVTVDREVMNKYALKIGQSIKAAIDEIGALGPYRKDQQKAVQQDMIQHIQNASKRYNLQMEKEMKARQAEVDSLAEYQRVSKICDHL